jgi:lipopolysaccharide biosynthesis glycosyltransferase
MTITRQAIVTVTSDAFLPGTLVTIDSFLRANPWFAGDIVILHEDLSPHAQDMLAAAFPGATLRLVSDALRARLDALIDARPEMGGRRARLLSLDAFALEGYAQLLFCDSDLLFTRDISALFDRPEALVAAPDLAAVQGLRRDPVTFEVTREEGLANSFNAGLMRIGRALLNAETARHLLDQITPAAWDGVTTSHTDQLLLNRAFAGQVALTGTGYNLLLRHRRACFAHDPVRIADARVLHFNGPAKPWRLDLMLDAIRADPALIPAQRLWHAACLDLYERLAMPPRGAFA